MSAISSRSSMLISGLTQGAMLLGLHEWLHAHGFHAEQLLWLAPLYALALLVPITFNFLRGEFPLRRALAAALALGGALAVTAAWFGWSIPIIGVKDSYGGYWEGEIFVYGLSSFVVWFIALPFFQAGLAARDRTFFYPALFANAWRNALLVSNCLAFVGAFWLLLTLWAQLFEMLKIHLFQQIFTSHRFAYPATAMAAGFAITLEVREAAALATLRRLLLSFQTRLLPLAAAILLMFAATLPFRGLQPLWNTGHAAALMLWLLFSMVVLVNAAWQDGAAPAFRRPTQMVIRVALALLPVLGALSAWAIGLRVQQHGWSVERVWGAIVAVLGGLYALGYAAAATRRGWLVSLGKVNVAMALAVIVTLLAVHTPLLDPQRISAASQAARLLEGKIDAEKFDYAYLRFELGRAGNAELVRLSSLSDHPQAELIRKNAANALKQTQRYYGRKEVVLSSADIASRLQAWPKGETIDPAFTKYLAARLNKEPWAADIDPLRRNEARQPLLVIDLNQDKTPEYVMLFEARNLNYGFPVFGKTRTGWKQIGAVHFGTGTCRKNVDKTLEQVEKSLQQHDYSLVAPEWSDLRIGPLTGRLKMPECGYGDSGESAD